MNYALLSTRLNERGSLFRQLLGFPVFLAGITFTVRLEPHLLHAMICTATYNAAARSPKGAQGLMPLMPATARRFGVSDPYDPLQNLHGGARYLRWLLNFFQGDVCLALAGHNAGEGAVQRYGYTIPPYPETQITSGGCSPFMEHIDKPITGSRTGIQFACG